MSNGCTAELEPGRMGLPGGELLSSDPRLAQRLIGRGILGIPEEAVAYYNLGIGLHQQRRLDAAIRAYGLALSLPGAPVKEATNNLAQDLMLNGAWQEGWRHYGRRFERRPGQHAFFEEHFGPAWGGQGMGQRINPWCWWQNRAWGTPCSFVAWPLCCRNGAIP